MANLKGGNVQGDSGNIKVTVRVRPFLPREEAASNCCIAMPSETTIDVTEDNGKVRNYTFDRAYWSHDKNSPHYATQETLMNELGHMLIDNALAGYNCCLFAYGQTGSGKTHSVLGQLSPPEMRGLLPRIVENLFKAIEEDKASKTPSVFKSHVSYLEIYNETIYDLLVLPEQRTGKLDAHTHPQLGIIIPGLSESPVRNDRDVQALIDFGAKTRTVAATCMNATSSRSHCIFIFELEKKSIVNGVESDLRSRVNLVDLAGSERQKRTEAVGKHLKEGACINQSLTCLAQVISSLAEAGVKKKAGQKADFVPFRNSKLTYILQDSLQGNSKTVMCAAISPSYDSCNETIGTLRFAENVKKIQTSAKKNEKSKENILAELKEEARRLRKQLEEGGGRGGGAKDSAADELAAVDAAVEVVAQKYGSNFEEELAEAEKFQKLREQALESMGLHTEDLASHMGIEAGTPQLINYNEDPSLSGCLMYFLMKDEDETNPIGTSIGSGEQCKIKLKGLGMCHKMLTIFNRENMKLTYVLCEGRVMINGKLSASEGHLKHNDRLILGHAFVFRVNIPNDTSPTIDRREFANVLQTVIADKIPEGTERYEQCLAYATELVSRLGNIKAELFVREFLRSTRWVEEANMIAHEFRSYAIYRFELEAVMDMYLYETAQPELLVRLYKLDTAKQRFRTAIKQKYGPKLLKVVGEVIGKEGTSCIAVYDFKTFWSVLLNLRDLYTVINREGIKAIDMENPAANPFNPFRQFSPKEVACLLEKEKAKATSNEAMLKVRHESRRIKKSGPPDLRELRSLQMEHYEAKSQFEAELQALHEKHAPRLSELDLRLTILRNQVGYHKEIFDKDGELLTEGKPKLNFSASWDRRLQRAGEEVALAMNLASGIISRINVIEQKKAEEAN